MATTSSIVNFVEGFKSFFKCPSNNGRCKGSLHLTLLVVYYHLFFPVLFLILESNVPKNNFPKFVHKF